MHQITLFKMGQICLIQFLQLYSSIISFSLIVKYDKQHLHRGSNNSYWHSYNQFPTDLVIFTEEILDNKLHFLCNGGINFLIQERQRGEFLLNSKFSGGIADGWLSKATANGKAEISFLDSSACQRIQKFMANDKSSMPSVPRRDKIRNKLDQLLVTLHNFSAWLKLCQLLFLN